MLAAVDQHADNAPTLPFHGGNLKVANQAPNPYQAQKYRSQKRTAISSGVLGDHAALLLVSCASIQVSQH